MTQEQIDKECDAIVLQHYLLRGGENFEFSKLNRTRIYIKSVNHAILNQTGIVETLRKLKLPFNNAELTDAYAVVDYRLDIAQQILETLKSRVK